MKKKIFILIAALVLITVNQVLAKEEKKITSKYDLGEVLVSATKTTTYQAETGSSTTVITAKDLEKKGKSAVSDLLREVPGVSVAQSGPFGGLTSIYIRGSKPGHTLVLIDGIELNDPMAADRSFNFAHLTIDNIERIEVVRGPQSTLYGSDAIGGVINIITKKGKGKPEFTASFEGGSHKTFREHLEISGATKTINYSIGASRLDSEGISKAADGTEEDSYKNTVISSKIGRKFFDNSELSIVARFTDTKTDLDDGTYNDDPNYVMWWRNFAAKVLFDQSMNSWWDYNAAFSYSNIHRKYRDEKDDVDTRDDMDSWYKGDNRKIEWQNNFYPFEWDTITCGFEYEEERGSSYYRLRTSVRDFNRRTIDNKGYYFQNQLKLWESLFIIPGLRIDDHELFGTELTYKISGAFIIPQTKTRLKVNQGTGFKAPSLYQLYSRYGDTALEPDESVGYDFGIEQNFFDNKVSCEAAYFHNDFENMISWDSATRTYKNIDKAETKGFEIGSFFKPLETLTINANYTYTKTKDKATGNELPRRPKSQASVDLSWEFIPKGTINLITSYVGRRFNDDRNTQKVKGYTKVDITASYELFKNFRIFGKIDNLFDKKYYEVHGFAAAKRSFYGGARATF